MAAFTRHGKCLSKLLKNSHILEVHINGHGFHTSAIRKGNISHLFQHRTISRLLRKPHVCCVLPARNNSTLGTGPETVASSTDVTASSTPGYIPDCPLPPEPIDVLSQLTALGEPTLASQGLGGWTPFGLVQNAMEALHVGLDVPWWGAIVIGTVCLRMILFPVVIRAQRNTANMHNHMPTVQRLYQRMTEERAAGNTMQAAKISKEVTDYQRRNNVNPAKAFLLPMFQIPIFISVFGGLRRMANLPVESMQTGGMLWFTDLTASDPYFVLPVLTSLTLLAAFEVGVDGAKASSMTPTMMYVMRGLPVAMCFFTMYFPAGMCVYWFTSNTFSLMQALFLRLPGLKEYFGIQAMVKHDPKTMPEKKGFVQGIKENWDNQKKIGQLEQRERVEAMRFKQAGTGPIQKTYAYDPTKVKSISAKSK